MCKNLVLPLIICLLLGTLQSALAQSMRSTPPAALALLQPKQGESSELYSGKKKKKKSKSSSSDLNFQHGLGLSLFIAPSTGTTDDNSAVAYGVTYYPSIRLAAFSDAMSLRLAASPSLGLSGSVNSQTGGSLSFAFELPVDAELHLGSQDLDGFGGHIGAGFAFNRIITSDFGDNKALGPHVTAGIKIPIRGKVYSLRGSYLLNISNKTDSYGYKGKNVIGLSAMIYL